MAILSEYRCKNCNKLFFKGAIEDKPLEIKCGKCGVMNINESNYLDKEKLKKVHILKKIF